MKYLILIISLLHVRFGSLEASQTKITSSALDKIETIYLGGGCFWGLQDLLRQQKGVVKTEVGYMGDTHTKATYELVKTGQTAFAETVLVKFDTTKTNLNKILKYFFKIHDPTTLNRQGNDIGKQYRSIIFFSNQEQKHIANNLIKELDQKKIFKNKITTELAPVLQWHKAEDNHQDYLQKNPDGYTCHYERKLSF